MTRGEARVGCSGWVYRDWRGLVYPPTRRSAGGSSSTPSGSTPSRSTTRSTDCRRRRRSSTGTTRPRRASGTPCKVGQYATHRKKLGDPEAWLANHLDRVERLGAHLGPNLLQLPPRWRRDTGRLDAFLALAPERIRWAVEVRDPSWLHDDVFEVLARHGAALCIHDLLPNHPWLRTTDWTYVRFHGPHAVDEPYHGRYTGRRLWRVADRLGALARRGLRRPRLLQQRLRRRRRRRRHLAPRPPRGAAVSRGPAAPRVPLSVVAAASLTSRLCIAAGPPAGSLRLAQVKQPSLGAAGHLAGAAEAAVRTVDGVSVWAVLGVGGAVALGAAAQQLVGFGFALLAMPFLTVLVGPQDAVAVAAVGALAGGGVMAWRMRRLVDRRRLRRLAPGALAGLPLGVWGLAHIPDSAAARRGGRGRAGDGPDPRDGLPPAP